MHWEALLAEVLNKAVEQQTLASHLPSSPKRKKLKCEEKKFFLGGNYEEVYFTNREAQVMVQLLQGKTIHATACFLQLSPRTVEFYVKNMKYKLSCRTKSELIGKVFATDFVKNVDFIANLISIKEDENGF